MNTAQRLIITFSLLIALGSLAAEQPKIVNKDNKKSDKVKKKLTPQQIAENKKYGLLPISHRKALINIDKMDHKLFDCWSQIVINDRIVMSLAKTWGVEARRNAEKIATKAVKDRPRMLESFNRSYDKFLTKLEKMVKRENREISKLSDKKTFNNQRLEEIKAEKMKGLKEQENLYEEMLETLQAMNKTIFSKQNSSSKAGDRLSQIGISLRGENSGFRKVQKKYTSLIEAAYDVKDLKTDISTLEKQKKEGKDWDSKVEKVLQIRKSNLTRATAKLDQLSKKEKSSLKKEIDKYKNKIEQNKAKLKNMPKNSSSCYRYNEKISNLETELFALQEIDKALTKISDWKSL